MLKAFGHTENGELGGSQLWNKLNGPREHR